MSSIPYQPNLQTDLQGAIPPSEYDDLSSEDLVKLLNSVTGRGQLSPEPTAPAPKRVVNLEHILGGLRV